ncbi:NAD(P)H dehydrogenase (quinone) [Hoeflea marina]|uniref:NAD(P)H dehydrogenase (Quinone) n=1 Tax=Hoeflea marina TaxID=274592 RepID=A0A317PFX0_9HYPH|nr:SDR family oxidoreductase [Hoeflea marina]PWV99101.1 NAD(P)H dehydrogenase (quinone) [Hoeflea marina]
MSKILVTGAAGHLGRLVVRHLIETEGVAPPDVIAGSRNTARLADLAAGGVELRTVDFDRSDDMTKAFAGVDRLLIISTDAVGSGKRLEQHRRAVAAAAAAGVGHIVYTSMPSPESSLVTFAGDHLGTEQAMKATGIPHTILRDGWYMENLFMVLPQALMGGAWYSSAGDGRLAHISRDDTARAIAAVLARDLGGGTLTLTGPQSFTTEELAELVRQLTGRSLAVVHLTDEQLATGMKAAGVPEPVIPMLVSFDANTREGHMAMQTDAFERLTGGKPQTLKSFLEANLTALAG